MLNLDPFRHTKVYQEAFEEGYQQGLREAFEEGRQENQREFVELALQARFGELDRALTLVADRMSALRPDEFAALLVYGSREELIARFGPSAVWVQETTAVEEQQ